MSKRKSYPQFIHNERITKNGYVSIDHGYKSVTSLKNLREKRVEFDCVFARYQRAREMSRSVSRALETSSRSTSGGSSKIEKIVAELDAYEMQLMQKVHDLSVEIKNAESLLDSLFTGIKAEIMKLRYINCMRWHEISRLTHYSISALYAINNSCMMVITDNETRKT
ncbi:hypothetical protein AGMMS49992_25850 [Clostridia bacterium]|nr:hypothetical protein AGMMS49992_25850 [Clostridia bacterium]